MTSVTNTNIRVGPGVYLTLKKLSENSGISLGSLTNLFIITHLLTNGKDSISNLPIDIQTALTADALSAIGDLFKIAGSTVIKNSTISDVYQKLLNPEKTEYIK